MIRLKIILDILLLLLITSCENIKQSTNNESNTTKKTKIGDFDVIPKPSFEVNSILTSSQDTLKIVTCAEFVYSPFGEINNKSDLSSSNLKDFHVHNKIYNMDIGRVEFQILTLNSNRLILFFDNDPESSRHSTIFKGEIKDESIKLINGIKIKITKEDFIDTFFDDFPSKLIKKYDCIVLESCVQDISHIYSFKDDKLQTISFITDSYWTIKY